MGDSLSSWFGDRGWGFDTVPGTFYRPAVDTHFLSPGARVSAPDSPARRGHILRGFVQTKVEDEKIALLPCRDHLCAKIDPDPRLPSPARSRLA